SSGPLVSSPVPLSPVPARGRSGSTPGWGAAESGLDDVRPLPERRRDPALPARPYHAVLPRPVPFGARRSTLDHGRAGLVRPAPWRRERDMTDTLQDHCTVDDI